MKHKPVAITYLPWGLVPADQAADCTDGEFDLYSRISHKIELIVVKPMQSCPENYMFVNKM